MKFLKALRFIIRRWRETKVYVHFTHNNYGTELMWTITVGPLECGDFQMEVRCRNQKTTITDVAERRITAKQYDQLYPLLLKGLA